MDEQAERQWKDWLRLMDYFDHEYTEGEITENTHFAMTKCLMTFKPRVEIEFEKEVNNEPR